MIVNTIINNDASKALRGRPDGCIHCCVTSPPYYGLRDYGDSRQIGLESTPEEYIERLVEVFSEVKRVLRDDGTLWINIADSYAGSGKGGAGYPDNAAQYKQGTNTGTLSRGTIIKSHTGCKPKDLIGIPWMLAFALRADGWYWRDTIIWAKPNPMPESVTDRTTKSHEYILLFSKAKHYYFDAESISELVAESTVQRMSQNIEQQCGSERVPCKTNGNMKAVAPRYGGKKYTENPDVFYRTKSAHVYDFRPRRNKRSVWNVSTSACKEAHFATFPEKLIVDCIKAGCPIDGVVLDPFFGSGTTGIVARKLDRNYIGCEINSDYIGIAKKRMRNELGIFAV